MSAKIDAVFSAGYNEAGNTVGIDGYVFSMLDARQLRKELANKQIELKNMADPMDSIWTDRPALPQAPACIYGTQYAGRTCREKLEDIRQEMKQAGTQALLLPALDEIAWTLNLRGNDVHCNPVVVSYLLIDEEEAHYFIELQKLTPEVKAYLTELGVPAGHRVYGCAALGYEPEGTPLKERKLKDYTVTIIR